MLVVVFLLVFFFFKQKTASELCGRDWSSDVCSSGLRGPSGLGTTRGPLVPSRAAEEIVWRAIQGAEQTSATVDAPGNSLLIRGPLEDRKSVG